MFGLGFWELVVIAVVALLFIGPDKLPNFFRALGRATREFQRASRELRENLSLDEPIVPPAKPPPKKVVDVAPGPGVAPRRPSEAVELPPPSVPAAPATARPPGPSVPATPAAAPLPPPPVPPPVRRPDGKES